MRLTHLFFISLFCLSANGQNSISAELEFDGELRDYKLFLPSGYDSLSSMPLVFNLHGFTSTAEGIEDRSQMNMIADTAGFIVCYPNGIDRAWNVGWQFGSNANDVGFINAMIDTFLLKYKIDPNRIYSTGFSNGGFMSYRLACELNDRIAAIASVAGGFSPDYFGNCEPNRPVPVMQIHGTFDLIVPINGSPAVTVPIQDVVNFWVENNECQTAFLETEITASVKMRDWLTCAPSSTVKYYIIEQGSHTWPGSEGFGVNQDIDASEEIWLFFKQFELNTTPSNLSEKYSQNISVFPNPVSNQLNFSKLADSYSIFNSIGQTVLTGKSAETISVSQIPDGLYFGKMEQDGNLYQFTFVKN